MRASPRARYAHGNHNHAEIAELSSYLPMVSPRSSPMFVQPLRRQACFL